MTEEDNMNNLLQALDNEDNESIMGLTSRKIKSDKNDILQRLQIKGEDLKIFHKKLKYYRYCDNSKGIRFGFYIRWIPLKSPNNIYLTNGGIICDFKVIDNKLHIVCKNNNNQLMQLKFDETIIFQKLSNQEQVILDILDYLNK